MKNKKIISTVFCLILFTLMILGILYFGPLLSKAADKSFRKEINKNGYMINALVSGKKYSKGKYVVYNFNYKGQNYINKELNSELYESLKIGESIEIKIDSTDPNDSYIITTP